MCEITRSKPLVSSPRLASGNSGFRITVRNNSLHKGLRRRIVESTIESLCSNSWRNNIGPVIEVQIVKILDQYGLETAIPSPNDSTRTSHVMISRGRSRFPMPNSDQVQNYSLNFRQQEEENLAWHSRRLAPRRLVRPMLQVRLASRKLVRTLTAFSPCQASCFTQRTNLTTESKWQMIPASSSYGGALPTAVSKMVTRLVRHYDQDEIQPDAALHWETIRPVLLKAFANHGARDFSGKHWLRQIHQGSSKTKFEPCEDSKNSLAYF